MKEYKFTPKLDNMQAASDFAEETLNELGCPMKLTMKFLIALDEVLNNVVSYSGARESSIQIDNIDGVFSVKVIDDGMPFNPLEKTDPDVTLDADERGVGGLGIYMVKKSMDNVLYFYENGKNVLKLEVSAGK